MFEQPGLGLKLKKRRLALKLSAEALAMACRLSKATIMTLENGTRKNVTVDTLNRLCRALGIEVTALVTRKPK